MSKVLRQGAPPYFSGRALCRSWGRTQAQNDGRVSFFVVAPRGGLGPVRGDRPVARLPVQRGNRGAGDAPDSPPTRSGVFRFSRNRPALRLGLTSPAPSDDPQTPNTRTTRRSLRPQPNFIYHREYGGHGERVHSRGTSRHLSAESHPSFPFAVFRSISVCSVSSMVQRICARKQDFKGSNTKTAGDVVGRVRVPQRGASRWGGAPQRIIPRWGPRCLSQPTRFLFSADTPAPAKECHPRNASVEGRGLHGFSQPSLGLRPRPEPSPSRQARQERKEREKEEQNRSRFALGTPCVFARDVILLVFTACVRISELSGNGLRFLRVSSTDSELRTETCPPPCAVTCPGGHPLRTDGPPESTAASHQCRPREPPVWSTSGSWA